MSQPTFTGFRLGIILVVALAATIVGVAEELVSKDGHR